MAAKKQSHPKSRKASKPQSTKTLKSSSAKKKVVSNKEKAVAKKKASPSQKTTSAKKTAAAKKTVSSKANKASASKKTAAKRKSTSKKAGSIQRQNRTPTSKAPAAAKRSAASKVASKKSRKPTAAKAKRSAKTTERPRLSTFSAALKLYETGFKMMQSEKFDKAKSAFDDLISQFPEETELLDRANVLIQACDNRIQVAKRSPRLHGADEFYEVGIAELNGQDIDKALEHLHQALKLSPKGDHIHYALAAGSALNGDREAALEFLGKAIQYRNENRFLADNDDDFESLSQDSDFIELISSDVG